MTCIEINERYEQLNQELRLALATMERKTKINEIYQEITRLQEICPHHDETATFTWTSEYCPYCGKHIVVR